MNSRTGLRVVLFREGPFWLAQGLEHDVGVQGEDLSDVLARLEIALVREASGLVDLPQAPPYFQDLWPRKAGLFLPQRALAAQGITLGIVA